jgi:penicillin-binding protein 1C
MIFREDCRLTKHIHRNTLLLRLALSLPAFILLLLIPLLLIPLPDPLFPDDYSPVILDEAGEILRVFLNSKEQLHFPPELQAANGAPANGAPANGALANSALANGAPAKLKSAVLCYEDRHFYSHLGIDPRAVLRALAQNIRGGETVSGASTITMQVARLMGGRSRTLPNKILESLQALKLEILYSKEDILQLYLNHAPYGGNIVGYQTACYSYYAKSPQTLTWAEAAALAILPNSPGLISPQKNRKIFIDKRNRLLLRLKDEGQFGPEELALAMKEPVPDHRLIYPFGAPHLAEFLRARSRKAGVIRTTLSSEIQKLAEEVLSYHMDHITTLGIANAAVLVAETESGKVRAYIGSNDYFDAAKDGQVDGVQSFRATGSVLKPFLYALAMDEGCLLPQTLLLDIPSQFGSFSPHNADLRYRGLVPAAEALIRSLNVPAVRLLSDYGVDRFYLFLKQAGLKRLFRPPQDYGLSLILGGAEASLFELASLYRGLARSGRFSPLRLVEDAPAAQELRLISPGAAYLTLEILKELFRPGAEYYWRSYQSGRPLAWKTGTSFGQKDAWSIGVSPCWTVAVWIGNFSGEGNANLKSTTLAAPLLFDLFNSLPPNAGWFSPEPGIMDVERICRQTGFRAGPDCEDVQGVSAPAGHRPLPLCPYHKKFFVTLDGKYRVNSRCWEPGAYTRETRLVFPAEVVQYLRDQGRILERIPPLLPGCTGNRNMAVLRLVYPEEGAHIWIPRDLDGSYQKVTLRAAHGEGSQILYWYMDRRYLGQTEKQHTQSLSLSRGWHLVEVWDRQGNRDRRNFYVAGSR